MLRFDHPAPHAIWLTTGQVAKQLGISTKHAAKLIDDGRLIGMRIPGSSHRRVNLAVLEEFERIHQYPKARGA